MRKENLRRWPPFFIYYHEQKKNMNRLIYNICEKTIEIGLLVLVGVVPLIFGTKGFNPILIKTTFAHILIFIMFLAWLAKTIEESKFKIVKTPVNLPLALFFLTCIVSFIFSQYKYNSIKGLVDFFCYIILFFIVINNVRNENDARRIIIVFLASSAIVSFYGLLQHFGIDFIPWISGGRIVSSMGGSNFFAGYLLVVIPICLGMFFTIESRLGKIFCIILLFSFILCLAWTFTRSSWLAFMFGLLLFFILKSRRVELKKVTNRKSLIGAGIFFTLLVAVIFMMSGLTDLKLFQSRASSIFYSISNTAREIPQMLSKPYEFRSQMNESPGARMTIWQGAYRMFLSKPIFGHGVGTFEVSFPGYRPSFYKYKFGGIHTEPHAHSEYFEILAEQGIFGLAMFLWFIFIFFNSIFKTLKKIDEDNFNLTLGSLCAVFSLLIEGSTSVNLRWTSPAIFLWLIAGLVFVISRQNTAEPTEDQISQYYIKINFPLATKRLIYILLVVTGFFMCTMEINLFKSNFHLGQAVKFAERYGRPDISVLECEEALKYEPTSVRALYYLGISYSLQGCADEAKDAYLQVVRLAPGYHQVDYNLGVAYYHLGMAVRTATRRKYIFEQSIKYLNRAMELDISNTEALKIINLLGKSKK